MTVPVHLKIPTVLMTGFRTLTMKGGTYYTKPEEGA